MKTMIEEDQEEKIEISTSRRSFIKDTFLLSVTCICYGMRSDERREVDTN